VAQFDHQAWEEEMKRERLQQSAVIGGAIAALAQKLGSEDAALSAIATEGATVAFQGHVLNEGKDDGRDRYSCPYIKGGNLTEFCNAWRQGDRVGAAEAFETAFFYAWGWSGEFASITALTMSPGHVRKAWGEM
jgi:hypothetical protein